MMFDHPGQEKVKEEHNDYNVIAPWCLIARRNKKILYDR